MEPFSPLEGMEELRRVVGRSCTDPQARGPVVVSHRLPGGRMVEASYCSDEEARSPDARTPWPTFDDLPELTRPVRRLLLTSEPFVTVTGRDDLVCKLKWTIRDTSEPAS